MAKERDERIGQNFTVDQGPSGKNQTSDDHGLDSNQDARQPSTEDMLESEGLLTEDEGNTVDLSSANID